MAAGTPVFDTFRHGISFCPDNVVAQIPACTAQGERQHPRDSDHILWLAALYHAGQGNNLPVAPVRIFGIPGSTFTGRAAIAVRDIQPECPIRAQHTHYFTEYRRQPCYVFLRCVLTPDLRVHAVITQAIIRRRSHAAMDAFVRQGFQHRQAIAAKDGVNGQAHCPFTSLGLVDMIR